MTDYDRGAYTPPTEEEAIAFDARQPRMRRPAPATLIGSVVVLFVLVVSVAIFYWSGVRGANDAPQVVGKPAMTIKTAPAISDAKPVDDSDKLEVYDEEKGPAAASSSAPKTAFAPPPEQPAPRGSLPAAAPAPVKAAPLPPAVSAAPARVAVATPPPAAPRPVLREEQAAATPSTAPAPAPARHVATDAFGQNVAAPAKPAKVAAAPAAPAAAPATDAAHGVMVQIGAFSSEAIADEQFARAKAAFASYTAGKAKHVERAEVGGKVYYRTAFAGFDRASAHAFCKALIAAKKGCIVR